MDEMAPPATAAAAGDMSIVVRAAREVDIEAMRAVELDAGRRFAAIGMQSIADDEPPAVEVFLEVIAAGSAWVVEDDSGVVGFALASEVDGEGHLDQVSVSVESGGRGLGRVLVENVTAWARSCGFHGLTLTTFRDVEFNGPLYAHLGFVEIPPVLCGPELTAIRSAEIAAGLDVVPRVAMRLEL